MATENLMLAVALSWIALRVNEFAVFVRPLSQLQSATKCGSDMMAAFVLQAKILGCRCLFFVATVPGRSLGCAKWIFPMASADCLMR
jgi:hypothetical protein